MIAVQNEEFSGKLVVESAEKGHASLDPVELWPAGGDLYRHHVVGGVTSGGEGAWGRREGRREGGSRD